MENTTNTIKQITDFLVKNGLTNVKEIKVEPFAIGAYVHQNITITFYEPKKNEYTMKGIYLTEESKSELEKRLEWMESLEIKSDEYWGKIFLLREILSTAIILPVEESWLKVAKKHGVSSILSEFYPNGVVISKQ